VTWVRQQIKKAHGELPTQIRSVEDFEKARMVYEEAELVAKNKHPDIWVGGAPSLKGAFAFRQRPAYREFVVTSRSGKVRQLREPADGLKLVQSVLGKILHNALHVEDFAKGPQKFLHGFIKGRSIRSNSVKHFRKTYVIKMDIKNYFESITKNMLMAAFDAGKLGGYDFPQWLLDGLLAYCFYNGRQAFPAIGLPSSPGIANVVSAFLVIPPLMRIVKNVAKSANCGVDFTMYADDLTFSSDSKEVIKLTRIVPVILRRVGLSVNSSKTKVLDQSAAQIVCGVVVNRGPSAPRSYRNTLRKTIHHMIKQVELGIIDPASININVLRGQVSYVSSVSFKQGSRLAGHLSKLEAVL
jgi:RNA-directed DNA polymerase